MFCVICIVYFVVSVFALENDDVLRDRLMENVSRARRVVCNTATLPGGVNAAASKFAAVLGKRQVGCVGTTGTGTSAGSSWADSCVYGSGGGIIKPIYPGIPTNPLIPNSMTNSFTGILGKRGADPSPFKNKPKRDYVFVLDTSGSVSMDSFERAKEGVAILTKSFCPVTMGNGMEEKQVAVVLFGNTVETAIPFSTSHDGTDALNSKIIALNHRRGSATATAEALRHVRQRVLSQPGSRLNDTDASTHVIVITDGRCNRGCQSLADEADKLRKMGPNGVQLFALGVDNARACELEIITGKGSDMAFGLNDFTEFEKFATAVRDEAENQNSGCI
ncbi:collagen alpha-1(XXII) chain-like [Lingula anatina]|uniref:Collagen alpha-1(XXII) chain-like n=1 Tax=Lingula anatina TaxID=7574 RepID=A0A1S3J3G5_LINAN|nr:collagen alpha-1(XXII) chain-like [Lingula anatina]|eukprot:XP_013404798.1 collagen alpha-1(XXII) chain-like [Lingula anatina]